jgi:hypothetical protein
MIVRERHTKGFLSWYDRLQTDRATITGVSGAIGRIYDEWREDAYNGGQDKSAWNTADHVQYATELFDDAYMIAGEVDRLSKRGVA